MTPDQPADITPALTFLGLLAAFYLVPTLIAFLRKTDKLFFLFLVNALLGWTVFIWFGCLIWAMIGQTKAQRAFYENAARDRAA